MHTDNPNWDTAPEPINQPGTETDLLRRELAEIEAWLPRLRRARSLALTSPNKYQAPEVVAVLEQGGSITRTTPKVFHYADGHTEWEDAHIPYTCPILREVEASLQDWNGVGLAQMQARAVELRDQIEIAESRAEQSAGPIPPPDPRNFPNAGRLGIPVEHPSRRTARAGAQH